MITLKQLESICATKKGREHCALYLDGLNQYMPLYGINTPKRVAHFIAQIAHESADFTKVRENLNYSADGLAETWEKRFRGPDGLPNEKAKQLHRNPMAIANSVYANRYGNGDEKSGDGWRYSGRGLKQLTFQENYKLCALDTGLPLLSNPELLEQPNGAAISACWFWEHKKCNKFADVDDIVGLTKVINGGLIGLKERRDYYEKTKEVFK